MQNVFSAFINEQCFISMLHELLQNYMSSSLAS
ncbi:unnamed protein product [Larinioides sclopetarius]|uniref:Maturase K n=1 Tax=Larinioides sclopetarius TaxID=280406 RepID=A0AAV2AFU7_9ARAC